MASEAFAGVGTKFQRWDGAAWQDIAEVNSIDGPGMTKDVLEVTSLDTDAGYNEFITGFAEGGTLTLDMNFTRETYELMKEDFESDEVRSYRIQLPDYDSEPSTFTIEGLVIELPITMTADDKVTADVVIQITSQVILDIGSTVPAEESEDNFAPGDISGLVWYLTAKAGVTGDSAEITEWADQSTSGNDAVLESAGGSGPGLSDREMAGVPLVEIRSATHEMLTMSNIALAGDFTIFVVDWYDAALTGYLLAKAGTTNQYLQQTGTNLNWRCTAALVGFTFSGLLLTTNEPRIDVVWRSGSNVYGMRNEVAAAENPLTNANAFSFDTLGGNRFAQECNSRTAAILVYNKALSESERNQVIAFLKTDWEITSY